MGEIAEATINGFYCQQCGCFIDGDEPGYPRYCEDCEEENNYHKKKYKRRK